MYTKPTYQFGALIRRFSWLLGLYLLYVVAIYFAYSQLEIEVLDITMAIATVLGFSVALLLGFRTAAAYDRWWEGRKIWGAIVNDSRTLIRQIIGFADIGKILPEVKTIAYYQIAWCHALKNGLRQIDPTEGLEPYLPAEEIASLRSSENVPSEILKRMEVKLAEFRNRDLIDPFQFVALDETLSRLCDAMGKCERIKNTVFPIQYRSYTHRGIIIFALMLPYGMLHSTGPLVILICMIVLLFFLMIETIAEFLQDPFSNEPMDVPMSALTRTIEINLLQLIEDSEIPRPLVPDERGILM